MSAADIHEACKKGDMDRVKALVAAGVSVNHKDNNGETLLYHSVEGNHIAIMRFLLGEGADPNIGNGEKKRSPLIAASEHGYTHLAECLLDHKAVVNQGDTGCCTPLWWAAQMDQTETAQLLLSKGADINKAANSDIIPLLIACMRGSYNTASLLLQHGADTNICNRHGWSPLHGAVSFYCYKSIVQLLLQKGVRIMKNNDGETPLDVALRKMRELNAEDTRNTRKIAGYKAIISMLENYTAVKKSEDGSDTEWKVHKKPQGFAAESDKLIQISEEGSGTEEKVHMKTQGSSDESDKIIQKSEDWSLTEGKVHKTTEGSAAQSDKILYQKSTDVAYQAEKEKGDSCIIDPDIVENVLANERMKEQEKEVKRKFQETEADDYLKDVYKRINNIGKEMKEPEITDDALSDKNLMKLTKEMTSDWRVVGGLLGVKHSDIKQLATDYKSDPRFAAWSMLVSWRDSTEGCMRGKIQALKEALIDADRQDIADML